MLSSLFGNFTCVFLWILYTLELVLDILNTYVSQHSINLFAQANTIDSWNREKIEHFSTEHITKAE